MTLVSRATLTEAPTIHRAEPANIEWQAAAIAEYEQSRAGAEAALRAELAWRVGGLTGQAIPAESVIVREGRRALVWVDGVQFRLEGTELTVVRACVHCGVNELTSRPIRDRADLGFVLGEWEPRCAQCPLEDPSEW